MNKQTKDHLELHFLVVVWSFTGILGLVIKVPPQEVVFYRTLISAVLLTFVLWFTKERLIIDWPSFIKLAASGFLFAGQWTLFFVSARISNLSICLAGMATMALWTSIIEPLFERGKISALNVILSMIAIVGISIIYNVEFEMASGLLLALLSALMGALILVLNKHLVRKIKPFRIMFFEMLSASVFSLILVLIISRDSLGTFSIQIPNMMDTLYLFILSGLCTVYVYSMSIKLMKRISAFKVSFAVNLEPVYGIVLALLIFGESEYMNIGFYFGSALILLAVFSYPYLYRMNNGSGL